MFIVSNLHTHWRNCLVKYYLFRVSVAVWRTALIGQERDESNLAIKEDGGLMSVSARTGRLQRLWRNENTFSLCCRSSKGAWHSLLFLKPYLFFTHPWNSSKPLLFSVCCTIVVHVEHFEGPVWTSQVEEVTQHLVTMNRATPSEKESRTRWQMFFCICFINRFKFGDI